jgi:RimJ/RimL family protein N-acetyltransferase
LQHFDAILRDERELASLLQLTPADDWLQPDAQEAMPRSYEYLKSHPSALGWWVYLFAHKADETLIGVGGFKGVADEHGMVEIGYSIASGYRARGLATEAARGLLDYAFAQPHVTRVDAHTLAERNASVAVLEKLGMKHVETRYDADDGYVWRWSLSRGDYHSLSSSLPRRASR